MIKELCGWFYLNLDVLFGFLLFDELVSMCIWLYSLFRSLWKVVKCVVNKSLVGSIDKKGYCELCDIYYRGM